METWWHVDSKKPSESLLTSPYFDASRRHFSAHFEISAKIWWSYHRAKWQKSEKSVKLKRKRHRYFSRRRRLQCYEISVQESWSNWLALTDSGNSSIFSICCRSKNDDGHIVSSQSKMITFCGSSPVYPIANGRYVLHNTPDWNVTRRWLFFGILWVDLEVLRSRRKPKFLSGKNWTFGTYEFVHCTYDRELPLVGQSAYVTEPGRRGDFVLFIGPLKPEKAPKPKNVTLQTVRLSHLRDFRLLSSVEGKTK